jgi:hypothetical protein
MLLLPVNGARETTARSRVEFARGEATEADVVEGLGALARLREMVISEGR